MMIDDLLKLMLQKNISDVHFKANSVPLIRYNGKLVPVDTSALSVHQVEELAYGLMTDEQKEIFERERELDMSHSIEDLSRFRINVYKQKGSVAMTLRVVPFRPKNFEELNLPVEALKKLADTNRGLILMAGITGAGKTTTLNAILDYINTSHRYNIISIEDPIEFYHIDKMSSISQREVGSDTKSFAQALKHVLRQDPDVISIGEIRSIEEVDAAIIAGETGHLVLSTIHTVDTVQTINRIISMYPPHQQDNVRIALSQILKGIVAQRLVSRIDQEGLVPAVEILVVTPLIKKLIAEKKDDEIYAAMQQGEYYGMRTFDNSLLELHKSGKIALEDALESATNQDELMLHIRGIYSGQETEAEQAKKKEENK
ncbi:MAG: PilT/PilU family type 4a pilus ATPase [bacterium]